MALHSCHLHSPIHLTRAEISGLEHPLSLAPRDFSYWPWSKPGDPLANTPKSWHNPYFLRRPVTLQFLEDLTKELKAKHYFDHHTIVFLSDHGERFVSGYEIYGGIHGIDLEGRDQNNVLLGIFAPKLGELKLVDTSVSLIDVAPTLVALLGGGDLVDYDGLPLLDREGNDQGLVPRSLFTESMGLIEASNWEGRFPQIPAGELESQLSYRPDGSVAVSRDFYRLIMGRKEFLNLGQVPELRQRKDAAPNPALGRLGLH